jgi:hypothetical protein
MKGVSAMTETLPLERTTAPYERMMRLEARFRAAIKTANRPLR